MAALNSTAQTHIDLIGNITPYGHYTDEEILKLVFHSRGTSPLMMELAFRMEALMDEVESGVL